MLMLMVLVLVITCMLLLMLLLLLVVMMMMMMLMRLLTRGRVLLRVRQSFVVHGGVEAQLLLPGLLLLVVVVRIVEVREGLLARIGVGIQVCGGEVEQGVLLRVIEVLHGAWDSGFRAIYSDG